MKFTDLARSGDGMNDETPISYLEPMVGMIESKTAVAGLDSNSNIRDIALTMFTS